MHSVRRAISTPSAEPGHRWNATADSDDATGGSGGNAKAVGGNANAWNDSSVMQPNSNGLLGLLKSPNGRVKARPGADFSRATRRMGGMVAGECRPNITQS